MASNINTPHLPDPATPPLLLIVDDDQSLQAVFKYIALNFNIKCKIFGNAEDALEEYEKGEKYTHIFLDWRLPGMSGVECAKKLREIQKTRMEVVPIIAVTAYASQTDKDESVSRGMDDYLSKPFTVGQFLDMVSKWSNPETAAHQVRSEDVPGHTSYLS